MLTADAETLTATATAGSAFLPHRSFFFCSTPMGIPMPSAPGAPIIPRTARHAICHQLHTPGHDGTLWSKARRQARPANCS